ncbi:hypothetical protein Paz_22 [Xylella phage Paz]|uniref:dATP/dGTP diphosphohydrolase N-terminal domain-containing protein n=1 Tax=Xylella phage Paz TaxID=1415145 RepID=V5Q7L8_9CAUD|nr:hypothetical protein Paz_22 [Xylella phage Paz]AHB12119.1 hypothetical protein Paz_22 [Xylella phage Paz]
MSRMLEAYRVQVVTSKDVENGATKGSILWLHSEVEDQPGYYYFINSPDSDVGIPLAVAQVTRDEDCKRYDRYLVEKPQPAEPQPTPVEPKPEVTIAQEWASKIEPNPRGAGLKFDAGKVRPSLLIRGMPRALLRVADVLTFGAQKYEAHSWRTVENGEERYDDAKLRHMFADALGEQADRESSIEHLAHEICNGLFLLEKLLIEKENAR